MLSSNILNIFIHFNPLKGSCIFNANRFIVENLIQRMHMKADFVMLFMRTTERKGFSAPKLNRDLQGTFIRMLYINVSTINSFALKE